MQVKNLNGTSNNKCKCEDWLTHLENFSGIKRGYCSKGACLAKATLGAHVQKVDPNDSSWYIIPLCAACNKGETSFSTSATLVSANVSQTCGKK